MNQEMPHEARHVYEEMSTLEIIISSTATQDNILHACICTVVQKFSLQNLTIILNQSKINTVKTYLFFTDDWLPA